MNEPCPDPCAVGRAAAAAGQVCRYHLDRQLKTTRLHLLERIASLIATGEDQQAVIRAVLEQLEEDLGYRRGLVMLVLVGGDRLVVAATTGEAPDGGGTQTYGPGEGIIGQVLANGEPIILSDINRSQGFTDRIYRRQETAAARARTAFVCVPVTIGQEIVGTLSLDIVDPGASTELEACRGVLAIVAAMLGHDVAARREIRQAQERMGAENLRLRESLGERLRPETMIGNAASMRTCYLRIHQVAETDVTVLIRGESGTGKELAAAAIHYASKRKEMPFVRVNCAALNENLLESELFGHVRGAFTGAVADRPGRIAEAEGGGTLFLDEIGEFSHALQVKLLRFLQEREYQAVGSDRSRKADVRIVSATNRDLEAAVRNETVRQDMYYRINVFPLVLPSLRERKDDILLLANHFCAKHGPAMGKEVRRISTPAITMLLAYHWPGNVRELENCIEHAVLLSDEGVIQSHHLPPTLQTPTANGPTVGGLAERVAALERDLIVDALKRNDGNASASARELAVTPRILCYKIKNLELDLSSVFA